MTAERRHSSAQHGNKNAKAPAVVPQHSAADHKPAHRAAQAHPPRRAGIFDTVLAHKRRRAWIFAASVINKAALAAVIVIVLRECFDAYPGYIEWQSSRAARDSMATQMRDHRFVDVTSRRLDVGDEFIRVGLQSYLERYIETRLTIWLGLPFLAVFAAWGTAQLTCILVLV